MSGVTINEQSTGTYEIMTIMDDNKVLVKQVLNNIDSAYIVIRKVMNYTETQDCITMEPGNSPNKH